MLSEKLFLTGKNQRWADIDVAPRDRYLQMICDNTIIGFWYINLQYCVILGSVLQYPYLIVIHAQQTLSFLYQPVLFHEFLESVSAHTGRYFTKLSVSIIPAIQGCLQEFSQLGGSQGVGAQFQQQKFLPQCLLCHVDAQSSMLCFTLPSGSIPRISLVNKLIVYMYVQSGMCH